MKGLIPLIKGKSFASLMGNGISAALGVLSFALLARFLTKGELGLWIIFLATYGIFETLRTGMILNALVRNVAQAENKLEERRMVGSALYLTVVITFIFAVLVVIGFFAVRHTTFFYEYLFMIKWYFVIALLTLPHNFSTWYLNARMRIISMSVVKVINTASFIILFSVWLYFDKNLEVVFYSYAISQLATTVFCMIMGWTGFQHIVKRNKESTKQIFHFGKFSMGTLIGSNLLKNSDSFLIGGILGTLKVAVYNVPTRVIEMIELPVRSFAITTLPLLSKLYGEQKHDVLKAEFERKTGFIFFLLLPLSVFCFCFAEVIVVVLGGEAYRDSAILLRLFAIYTAFIPLDKFSGIMLDIINKPEMNFIKVMLMLVVNIVGDYIGLIYFKNLESVAIVSTLTYVSGMIFGFVLLKKYIGASFGNVFKAGINECNVKLQLLLNRTA